MTTDLATVQQLHNPLELSERDREAAEAVASGLRDAKAANTRRSYASAWRLFQEWAEAGGHAAMPATPQAVALYLGHLAASGRSIATVQQARSAISHYHAATGMQKADNPARHPVVAEAVKGWRNRAPSPKQASALTADALARVRETLRPPRRGRGGRMESAETAQQRAALDLAIIGVLADGGLRRSEAAALTWGDVELWAAGTGRLKIQEGKNQVEPQTVAVPAANAQAFREIRPENHRSLSSGMRTDQRGLDQPGPRRGEGCLPGQRVHRTQQPHRHGPTDDGSGGTQRRGAAPGPVEHGDRWPATPGAKRQEKH